MPAPIARASLPLAEPPKPSCSVTQRQNPSPSATLASTRSHHNAHRHVTTWSWRLGHHPRQPLCFIVRIVKPTVAVERSLAAGLRSLAFLGRLRPCVATRTTKHGRRTTVPAPVTNGAPTTRTPLLAQAASSQQRPTGWGSSIMADSASEGEASHPASRRAPRMLSRLCTAPGTGTTAWRVCRARMRALRGSGACSVVGWALGRGARGAPAGPSLRCVTHISLPLPLPHPAATDTKVNGTPVPNYRTHADPAKEGAGVSAAVSASRIVVASAAGQACTSHIRPFLPQRP